MGCFSEVLTKFKTLLGLRNEGNGEAAEFSPLGQDKHMFFKMENLIAATGNFDETNKLGEGGFGPVYKGILENGREIAVKKLSVESKQGRKEFLSEIKLVAKVQHRNLVSLIGCCAEGSERLLVYEYLPNSSLDRVLFDSRKHKQLDWQKRYNIIMGIARGLLYLHEDSQLRIIHRDIKASNILLDEKWHPKIADFGLARLYPDDQTHISTRVAGTYGYMAPEYFTQGKCSLKVDIYSFGVLLLEIVSGRKNTDYSASEGMECLLKWAWKSHKKGTLEPLIDPDIKRTCPIEQAVRCIYIGLLCTQADDTSRPAMSTVTLMLSSHSVRLPNITKPAFYPTAPRNSKSSSSSHPVTHVSHGSSRTSATSSSASAFSSQAPTIHSS